MPDGTLTIILVLYLGGVGLILAELFMPIVILGVLGLAAMVVAIGMAFAMMPSATLGVGLLIVAVVVVPAFMLFWLKVLGKYLAVKTSEAHYESGEAGLDALLGAEGVAATMLRPAGIALINNRRVDVVTAGEIVEKNTRLKVVEVRGNRVVVRPSSA